MADSENTNKSSGLPNKAFKVKNKAPAPIQITAEQLIREAQSRQLDVPTKRKAPKITDEEELAEHYRKKRKEYEDDIRKNRIQLNNWTKYAKFEISIGEIERARNVYERALSQFPTNPTLYLQYAEMECKNKQVNHARNIYDRAVLILPRNSQFWTKYALLEETIGNIPGARTVFERWMETEPDEQAWQTYINFEKRYKEHDKVANIYQRFLHVHGDIEKNWVKYAKYEESAGIIDTARKVFESAVNYFQEHVSGYLLSEFAKFEERQKEIERVRTICQFALKNLPEEETGEIFNLFTKVEKRHGTISDIENAVFAKRKNIYEKEIEQNGYNYDAWFDYLKLLCQFCQTHDEIIDGFERAISWCPPSCEKRDWRRYIYVWIKYAIYTELVMNDVERTKQIYKKCIELIPHKAFTFAKIWIMFGEFELRHDNLDGYRKIMGRAIGQCPKNKLFDSYIETEIKLQEFDRCRILYTKWLEFSPENPNVWIKYAELETLLDEIERARSIFDTAVKLPQLDMPEALWKAYIDFEIKQENYSNARLLFERLLKLANNIKIWLTYAEFEISIGKIKNGRKVYERANTALLNGKKEDRITLLKAWRTFEKRYGDTESKNNIKALMPKKIKKRRQIQTADGIDAGWEEYFDYVFAQDQTNKGGFKLLEAAKRWKEKQTEGDK
uniref:Protein crooked neck (inferred by orthology to a D. melanogaster protein) n=1 Tax=Strongyloides venezuelensis TaxID=75913 RepID=A0A0K0FKW4_STRVS